MKTCIRQPQEQGVKEKEGKIILIDKQTCGMVGVIPFKPSEIVAF